jgi:hypothetical protein
MFRSKYKLKKESFADGLLTTTAKIPIKKQRLEDQNKRSREMD